MTESGKHRMLLVLVAGLVIFFRLGTPHLWDDDEPRNATCAAEMLSRGDLIVPTFNAPQEEKLLHLRTDKPILLYWFTMAAYSLLGVNELAARLTSALCGICTVLLTYDLGRRMFGAVAGLWAGLLLSSSIMFVVASRAATPDSLLIFFSTLAIWFFVRGSFAEVGQTFLSAKDTRKMSRESSAIQGLPQHGSTYALMYASMSLAVLAKGPVGLVLPSAVIGLYLLVLNPVPMPKPSDADGWRQAIWSRFKEAGRWLMRTLWPPRVVDFALELRPLTALAVVAIVALPWYLIVGVQTDWAWPAGFFLKHNLQRFTAPMEGHRGPPFYHLISLAAGFFPASVFLLPTVIHAVRSSRLSGPERRGYLLAICWIVVYLIVFSFAGTKLPNYVTPTYPALALLTGALMQQWLARPERNSRAWQVLGYSVFALAGVGIAVGVTLLARRFLQGEGSLGLLGLIPAVGGIACLLLVWRQQVRTAVVAFAVFATAFTTATFGWGLERVDRFQNAAPLAAAIQQHSTGTQRVHFFQVMQPSWVFYTRGPLTPLENALDARQFFEQPGSSFLVASRLQLPDLRPHLPAGVDILAEYPRFLKSGSVVLLGRRRADEQPDRQAAVKADYSRLR